MDRSLDEIISERPVSSKTISLSWTIAHYLTSNVAAAAVATAVDADPTDALLPLPEDLAEKKAPETASER
jgi:hypothetical protein